MNIPRHNCPLNEWSHSEEEYRLIWLDANIDGSEQSNLIRQRLLELNPAVQFYTNTTLAIDVIRSTEKEQIFLITSGSLARDVLGQLARVKSVLAVFIFCADLARHISLASEYPKIVVVCNDQTILIKSIQQTSENLERQMQTFSLFDQKQHVSRDLSKENARFLWHQMIFHVLEQMPQDDQSKEDLLAKCRDYYQFNPQELNNIAEFTRTYSCDNALEWYTKECFLYKLLNKALRIEDFQLIYSFRFLIIDICAQIKRENVRLKHADVFTVYRGQQLPKKDLDKWKASIGTILCFNGFISTTRDIDVSLKFARSTLSADDMQAILFEIEVDPSIENTLCADISDKAQYQSEQEILFNLNSLFEIMSVNWHSELDIWKVRIKTTNRKTVDVEQYLVSVQQQIDNGSAIVVFGWLLVNELGQVNQAEKYFQMLLRNLPSDHTDIAAIYNGIGRAHSQRNELDLALEYYKLAHSIRQQQLPLNYSHVAASLHNIGSIYQAKRKFDEALDYYRQALAIEEDNYREDREQKAVILQNIGNILTETGDFSNALIRLNQALEIFEHILPGKHPKIGTCLGYLGLLYAKQDRFEQALDYYQREVEIDEYCLSPDHPDLSKDYKNIVSVYIKNKQVDKAFKFCHRRLEAQKAALGHDHPQFARILMIIAKVVNENNSKKALRYYQAALRILEKNETVDPLTLAKCRYYIGRIYGKYGEFSDAVEELLKALNLYEKILPSDDLDIADTLELIGQCYQKSNQSSEALRYFQRSLSIYHANSKTSEKQMKLLENQIQNLSGEQLQPIATVPPPVAVENIVPSVVDSSSSTSDQTKTVPTKEKRCPNCVIL